ncbi:winged helix-turn-helix domain-containing protein [Pseudokineococcus basanitobsidens]|uniref:Winged helix-turn-helix domain-containing protein n=1 Tax=Pseudokineococcus basanitobsidens TaxID=1926649 RepID=A0ABU8RPD5_9ACTN
MGVWRVTADVLATSRFALSPLSETFGALGLLATGDAPPWQRAWAEAHRPAFRARVAADPFSTDLLDQVLGHKWVPDYFLAPPVTREARVTDELATVRATPRDVALADLAVAMAGAPLPVGVQVPDPAGATADLLAWVWEHTVAPDWPRRRRQLQADITARSAAMTSRGWAAALADLGPKIRWLGEGQLQINAGDRPPRDLTGARLFLVPITAPRGWVMWDQPHAYALVYPAGGALAPTSPTTAPTALRDLLGATRADLLTRLDTPASTSQLAAATGLALGTVAHHLRVLNAADLIHRRRAGRDVLYQHTDLGRRLSRTAEEASDPGPSGRAV